MDFGYASAALVTPLARPTSRQARTGAGFDQAAFTIGWDTRRPLCPQGQASNVWAETTRRGKPVIRVRFPADACRACPVREQCTTSTPLVVQPAARAEGSRL